MQIDVREYKDIGDYLRDIREAAGLDIRDIGHQLNIRAKYLLALENGTLSDIPGKVYARGYLQNYAEFLGINKDEVTEAFDRLAEHQREVKYFVPEPTSRSYQPGMLMVGSALAVVALIYLYWYSTHKSGMNQPLREMVSPVPERLLNPLEEAPAPFASEGEADWIGPRLPVVEATDTQVSGGAMMVVPATPESTSQEAAQEQRQSMPDRKLQTLPWLKESGQ